MPDKVCVAEDCHHPQSEHIVRRELGEPSKVLHQYGKREMEVTPVCLTCEREKSGRIATGSYHAFMEA